MKSASLELCKELYELSGWEDTGRWYPEKSEVAQYGSNSPYDIPAYDLGYLLRKLPKRIERKATSAVHGMVDLTALLDGTWDASYRFEDEYTPPSFEHSQEADTPEDATAKLAIELWKQGVLKQ